MKIRIFIVFSLVVFLQFTNIQNALFGVNVENNVEFQSEDAYKQGSVNYRKGPYLLYTSSNTQMSVLWQTFKKIDCKIEWGQSTDFADGDSTVSEYGDDHQYKVILTDLLPDTYYYYRVVAGGDTAIASFVTGKLESDSVLTFYAYGDTRTYPADHDAVAKQMLKNIAETNKGQTFIISDGDLVGRTPEETDSWTPTEGKWDDQFFDPQYKNISKMLATMPYMACVGNYEIDDEGALFRKYFPYDMFGAERYYYSFDNGPVHFVVVDQFTDYSIGSEQYNWIKDDLKATNKKWKMILMHKPGWSAGKQENNYEVQKIIQPLAVEYGVQFIFTGHNHNYSRAIVGNVIHITSGGGGAPLYDVDVNWPKVVVADKSYNFCKIEISGDELLFSAIRSDGSLIEKFTYNEIEFETRYTLNVDTIGEGEVRIMPFKNDYDKNEMVILNAIPATGYEFIGWSGDYADSNNYLYLVMDSAKKITATFSRLTGNSTISGNKQNLKVFPNPASGNITINYNLSGAGNIDLSVFNISGKKVATLLNAKENAGLKNILWNGCNSKGERLTGMNLIVLKFDNIEVATYKILISD